MMTKNFKIQVERFQENIRKSGKESFNGTLKPICMGCCQKASHSWKEVLEAKFEFELVYNIHHFRYASILSSILQHVSLNSRTNNHVTKKLPSKMYLRTLETNFLTYKLNVLDKTHVLLLGLKKSWSSKCNLEFL
jgi:hypothetical protein